jgi:putative ABC transport system permease protein
MTPRFQKVKRDLVSNKSRTLLVVITIAVGVFAFGSVFITRGGLLTNLRSQYTASKASSINLFIPTFDEGVVRYVKTLSDVEEAQGRSVKNIKLTTKEKTYDINLYAYRNFNEIKLNLPKPESGIWPPPKGEISIEKATADYASLSTGDEVIVELPNGKKRNLRIGGIVYESSAPPPAFTGLLTGYATFPTFRLLGLSDSYNRLDVKPASNIVTTADAESIASNITDALEDKGIFVTGSLVFKPNTSPGEDPSNAFTAILVSIGVFSLFLSALLVINTISAVMASQRSQIGIMKAIGGTRKQIIGLYLLLVFCYGLLSLVIAIPIAVILGYGFLKTVTDFINLKIEYFGVPFIVLISMTIAALGLPILAALVPIYNGSKLPVRDALYLTPTLTSDWLTEKVLSRLTFLSRPLLLSFRNIFRKRGRLVLTVGTLTLGGMLFISVINVRSGMRLELVRLLQLFDFSVSFSLDKAYELDVLKKRALEVPHVVDIEGRNFVSAKTIANTNKDETNFSIVGVPLNSKFITPTVLDGRWITEQDKNALVVSSALVRKDPTLTVGREITTEIKNQEYTWNIIGVYSSSGDVDAFSSFPTVASIKDEPNKASILLIKTDPNTAQIQDRIATELDDTFNRAGIEIAGIQKRHELESSISSSFDFLIGFLLTMAFLVAIVGGLGLAGTMGLTVMERTREIGVMRSIGATNGAIRTIFIAEALFLAILSWMLAIPLSTLFTILFDFALGNAFFERVLVFTFEFGGVIVWLILLISIASIASFLPARNASRMSIRDTLAYE